MRRQSPLSTAALVALTMVALNACTKPASSDPTPALTGGGSSPTAAAAVAPATRPESGEREGRLPPEGNRAVTDLRPAYANWYRPPDVITAAVVCAKQLDRCT